MKHTREPWTIGHEFPPDIHDADPAVVIEALDGCLTIGEIHLHEGPVHPPDEGRANAARIVACVNELAGIDGVTDLLPALRVLLGRVQSLIEELHVDDRSQYEAATAALLITDALRRITPGA